MKSDRLLYPDICKFVGIFVVTWSHCAQCISGMTWTNLWGGGQFDTAFTMPLFMLMSGWFINPEKMRNSQIKIYIYSKFKRLIIPSFVWFFVLLILSFNLPDLSIFTYYWYLNALFVCLCVIMICTKIIKSDLICCAVSTSLILLIPYSDFSHVNFMIPFLWAGYGLRKICSTKYALQMIILFSIIGLCLCPIWSPEYSVYLSPFNSLHFDCKMAQIMLYRFVIGFTLSAVIIYSIMKMERAWISKLSKLGTYSLIIYTSSLACLAFFSNIFYYLHIHTNRYGLVDILSLILCLFIFYVTIRFADYCKRKRLLRLLFLGE